MADAKLNKGDRFTIDPREADGFLMPLRKYIREGRAGTVIAVKQDRYLVEFDWRGRTPKPIIPTTYLIRFASAVPLRENEAI